MMNLADWGLFPYLQAVNQCCFKCVFSIEQLLNLTKLQRYLLRSEYVATSS